VEGRRELQDWDPDFVSVTYGAGGTTKAPTLATVSRIIAETPLATAAHLTCVGATKEETHSVVDSSAQAGVKHFVALRGDARMASERLQPHPGGYANAAELVAGLRELGDFEISVSAYPEKHPESRDVAADIDMLKRKADNGADRALTQFFFDNDNFERYLEKVRAAGHRRIPVVPGHHADPEPDAAEALCRRLRYRHSGVPDERFAGLSTTSRRSGPRWPPMSLPSRSKIWPRGISDFHLYTMNRSPLVSAVCDLVGFRTDGTGCWSIPFGGCCRLRRATLHQAG
jgi:methylenetetrahydrofolate reductase (NADPH)